MTDGFLRNGFRKVTGPIEHWVTTYHTGYWGFRPDKEAAWESISVGEVFLFHASASKFLDAPRKEVRDAGKGVIGMGRVGAKSTKDHPAWWEEIHGDGTYPYLIHFSEIHWFGDTDSIRDAPVRDKSVAEMVQDVHALDENKITFKEMDERAGYRIPAQGSPGNVTQPEKLFPLLIERIQGINLGSHESDGTDGSTRLPSAVRERTHDHAPEASTYSTEEVTYEVPVAQTMEGWVEHEHSLDTFEDTLLDAGFEAGETDHSDLLAWRDTDLVLAEAKAIHESNERTQIRKALGQLHEYSYFDVRQHPDRAKKDLTRCLLLTQEPSAEYREFLTTLQMDKIFTFWTDEFNVRGLSESMNRLDTLLS